MSNCGPQDSFHTRPISETRPQALPITHKRCGAYRDANRAETVARGRVPGDPSLVSNFG
jgi:hypothetical protein